MAQPSSAAQRQPFRDGSLVKLEVFFGQNTSPAIIFALLEEIDRTTGEKFQGTGGASGPFLPARRSPATMSVTQKTRLIGSAVWSLESPLFLWRGLDEQKIDEPSLHPGRSAVAI